jgi:hypothetical protein
MEIVPKNGKKNEVEKEEINSASAVRSIYLHKSKKMASSNLPHWTGC